MKLYYLQWDGVVRLSSNLHIACTKSGRLSKRKAQTSILVRSERIDYICFPFSTRWRTNDKVSNRRERNFTFVREFISPSPATTRDYSQVIRRISNIPSFLSFRFSRDSFAHQFRKTCTAKTWQTWEFIAPLPVVIYLRFVCPSAGKEIRVRNIAFEDGGWGWRGKMEGWGRKNKKKKRERKKEGEETGVGINFVRVNRIFGGRERRSPIVWSSVLRFPLTPPAHLLFKDQTDCERVNSNLLGRWSIATSLSTSNSAIVVCDQEWQ